MIAAPSRSTPVAIALARSVIACNACFDSSALTRAGIALPQPFAVGRRYRAGGTALVGINPGASMDGGYKESRRVALQRFAAGEVAALETYWDALASDSSNFWNPKYLARVRSLGLEIEELLVGNIALCATLGNKYPKEMLRGCWSRHTEQFLRHLAPGKLILMGSTGVMDEFAYSAQRVVPQLRVARIAHYAHREGRSFEAAECARVRAFLGNDQHAG